MKKKILLRKELLKIREDIPKDKLEDISFKITAKIINSDDFKNARNIALYYPIKGEVSLLSILNFKDKNFYFPKCEGNELKFYKYDGGFINDKFNIPVAKGEIFNEQLIDIFYIPALALNSKNYRLGYGKGFYDRFFAKNNLKAKKIVPISKLFLNKDFPQEKTDLKADEIICE